jgi:molybdopterin biosynthesis enzyme MoaB
VLDREIPGIAEAIRAAGVVAGVPSAMLSRGLAGLAGNVLIVNLAGSSGGVREGMAVLAPVLGHAVDQAHGGDHPRPPGAVGPSEDPRRPAAQETFLRERPDPDGP